MIEMLIYFYNSLINFLNLILYNEIISNFYIMIFSLIIINFIFLVIRNLILYSSILFKQKLNIRKGD